MRTGVLTFTAIAILLSGCSASSNTPMSDRKGAKKEQDLYNVKLNVSSGRFGNLFISSEKRQSISYYGLAGELKD